MPKLHVVYFSTGRNKTSTGHEGDRNALGFMFILMNLLLVSIKRYNLRLIRATLDFNALD